MSGDKEQAEEGGIRIRVKENGANRVVEIREEPERLHEK